MNDFEEITRLEGLPRLGETVRSKDYGTLWRVIEKREVWQTIPDPETGERREVPGIYLSYWRIREGVRPGVGKVIGFTYTLYDYTFSQHWEILSERPDYSRVKA